MVIRSMTFHARSPEKHRGVEDRSRWIYCMEQKYQTKVHRTGLSLRPVVTRVEETRKRHERDISEKIPCQVTQEASRRRRSI